LALSGPQVEVTGWLEDLAAVLATTRVAVAPLRYGAGLKLKIVEAMGHGVPVVTTAVGAEGLGAEYGVELLVADEPYECARQVCALLTDDELWHHLSRSGQELVRERYARATVAQLLRSLLPAENGDRQKL
jgi:glycosyltransferase involved in cell wall biosynthesis